MALQVNHHYHVLPCKINIENQHFSNSESNNYIVDVAAVWSLATGIKETEKEPAHHYNNIMNLNKYFYLVCSLCVNV